MNAEKRIKIQLLEISLNTYFNKMNKEQQQQTILKLKTDVENSRNTRDKLIESTKILLKCIEDGIKTLDEAVYDSLLKN